MLVVHLKGTYISLAGTKIAEFEFNLQESDGTSHHAFSSSVKHNHTDLIQHFHSLYRCHIANNYICLISTIRLSSYAITSFLFYLNTFTPFPKHSVFCDTGSH
jgi:hypothetical protein